MTIEGWFSLERSVCFDSHLKRRIHSFFLEKFSLQKAFRRQRIGVLFVGFLSASNFCGESLCKNCLRALPHNFTREFFSRYLMHRHLSQSVEAASCSPLQIQLLKQVWIEWQMKRKSAPDHYRLKYCEFAFLFEFELKIGGKNLSYGKPLIDYGLHRMVWCGCFFRW